MSFFYDSVRSHNFKNKCNINFFILVNSNIFLKILSVILDLLQKLIYENLILILYLRKLLQWILYLLFIAIN